MSVIVGVDAVLLVGLTGDGGKPTLVFGDGVVKSSGEMVVLAFARFPALLDMLQGRFQNDAARFVFFLLGSRLASNPTRESTGRESAPAGPA